MSGKILTPQDPQVPAEFNVMVNVNGNPTPLPVAKLVVANEIATALGRIANALERAYPAPVEAAELTNVVPLKGGDDDGQATA
jgi:hypothetical protein